MLCVLLLSVLDSGRQAKEKSHVHDGDFESDCMILKRRLEWKSNSIKLVSIVSPFPLFFNAWDAMNQGRVGMEAWYSSLSAFYPILIPRKGYNFWPLIVPNKIRT